MTRFVDFITKHKAQLFLLARFLVVGVSGTLLGLLILYILTHYFGLWYLLASTAAFIVSGIFSFTMQKLVTFRDKTTDRVHHQAVLFFAVAVFGIVANGAIMFILVELFLVPYMLAQVFSAAIIATWNLAAYRFVIFKKITA